MNYRFKHRLTGKTVVLNDVASAEVKNGTVLREDHGYDVAADVPYIRFVHRGGFIVYAFANVGDLEVSDGGEFS